MKKISITLFLLTTFIHPICAEPLFEKVWVGMTTQDFNKLHLGKAVTPQAKSSILTSYGIRNIDTPILNTYFNLKNHLWKGLKVEVKNNQIQNFTLQSKLTKSTKVIQNSFSDLMRLHGTNFKLKNFKSFSKNGDRFVWYQNKTIVYLSIVEHQNNQYNITIKKSFSETKPQGPEATQFMIASLKPILGKSIKALSDFHLANNK